MKLKWKSFVKKSNFQNLYEALSLTDVLMMLIIFSYEIKCCWYYLAAPIPMSTHNNNFRGELRRKQQPGNSLYLGIPLSLLKMTPVFFLKEDVITSLLEI